MTCKLGLLCCDCKEISPIFHKGAMQIIGMLELSALRYGYYFSLRKDINSNPVGAASL